MFSDPTHERRMVNLRYKLPEDYLTICAAIRDVYAETTDEEIKKKLRYIENVAHEIVAHVEKLDPGWLKNFYPKRQHYEKIMAYL